MLENSFSSCVMNEIIHCCGTSPYVQYSMLLPKHSFNVGDSTEMNRALYLHFKFFNSKC